mgnify:CR=1 FL=1
MCAEWLNDFAAFYTALGPMPSEHHTLDRVNNSKGYEPGNCRWATRHEQQLNRRQKTFVSVQGRQVPLSELCRAMNLNWFRAYYHLVKRGRPLELVLHMLKAS